jgi:F-type H+-transporting ATPase subunit delta
MSGISLRYARALFESGTTNGAGLDTRYGLLLESFITSLNGSPAMQKLLLSPHITAQTKKNFLATIFSGSDDIHFLNFMKILIDKDRMINLEQIALDYHLLELNSKRILEALIESAFPLDSEMIGKITSAFRIKTGANEIRATVKIVPELIGGIRVSIGSKVYDGTTRSELDRLYEKMKN